MATLDLEVTASGDDAQETDAGTVTINGTSILTDATNEWGGARFLNVTIEPGSTIDVAYMSLMPVSGGDEPNHTFYGHDTATPAIFTAGIGNTDISERTRTTANTVWASADLGANGSTYFDTPSLVDIVQEIIDLPGWASGNNIAFVWHGSADANRDLQVIAYDSGPGNSPPLLHIEYTAPSAGISIPVVYHHRNRNF